MSCHSFVELEFACLAMQIKENFSTVTKPWKFFPDMMDNDDGWITEDGRWTELTTSAVTKAPSVWTGEGLSGTQRPPAWKLTICFSDKFFFWWFYIDIYYMKAWMRLKININNFDNYRNNYWLVWWLLFFAPQICRRELAGALTWDPQLTFPL